MARPRGYSDIPLGYRGVWLSSARRLAGPGKCARFGKRTNDASHIRCLHAENCWQVGLVELRLNL